MSLSLRKKVTQQAIKLAEMHGYESVVLTILDFMSNREQTDFSGHSEAPPTQVRE